MHSHRRWVRRWVIGAACCATLVSPIGYARQIQASQNTAFSARPQSETQPTAPAAGSITGLAFRDYNANGARDPREPGLPGILVTAYDATGATHGSATTANDGSYTLVATGSGPYRIEFTNTPSYLRPGPAGSANGTTVQFVADGNSININAGFANPADYVAANPELAVVVFSAGDQSSTAAAIVSHPYYANTDTAAGLKAKAKTNEIGSVLGLAYKRATQDLFAAAYTKRGVGFGPGGIGAIYKVPASGAATVLVDLGSAAGSFSKPRDLNPDPPDFDAEAMSKVGKTSFGDLDISSDEKTLWTINLANRSLYKIDIAAAETGPGDAGATLIGTHPDPGCLTGVARPFALEVKDDVVYVGGICTGELGASSGTTNTITAYVFTYTQNSGWGSQPALNFPLNYPTTCADVYAAYTPNKSCNRPGVIGSVADWWSWFDDLPKRVGTGGYEFNSETPDGYVISPQPIFSDLEIDGTDMVIGLRDRFGDQVGWDDPGPSGIGNSPFGPSKNMLAISAADVLRAGPDGAGKWKIEANATGTTFGPGQHPNDGSGPCNGSQGPNGQNCGEFYNDNFNPSPDTGHDETAVGSLAQIEGAAEVVATIYDPYRYQSAGTGQLSNANGSRVRAYEIFRGGAITLPGARLNKVNGLGDVEILTDPAPIELGNRVWRDVNGNGLQDASEPGIQNVTLRLYRPGMGPDCVAGNGDDNAAIARAITNDKGEYFFKDGVGADPQIDAVGLVNGTVCKLQPGAAYSIRVDNADDYNLDEPLEGLTLTERDDAVASLGGSDRVDSDAALVGRQGWITHTLGSFGENDHTLDFGFVPGVSLGNQVWFDTDNDSAIDPNEVGVANVTLTLLFDGNANGVIDALEAAPIATTTTNSTGFYLFANGLLPGNYAVCIPQPNFGAGATLQGYHSSGVSATPNGALSETTASPANTDADNVDDGARQAPNFCANGVGSSLITLSNNEPTTEVPTNTPATQPGKTPGLTDPVPNANSNVTVDFGFYQARLGNLIWSDANNNGLRDAAEAGLGTVSVRLFAEDGATEIPIGADGVWATADDAPGGITTIADGTYALQGLPQGNYIVRMAPPANYISSAGAGGQYEPAPDNDGEGSTTPNRNNDDNGTLITSGIFSGSIESKPATLTPGSGGTINHTLGETDNKTLDFGLTRIVDPNAFSIGNRVWMDTGAGPNTNNGLLDGDERGLPGLTVTLYAIGTPTPILTTTTDALGYYRFDGLASGDYAVQVPLLDFYSPSDLGEADPNLNGESNNNCVNNLEFAARTNTITLEPGGLEPTNEPDVNPGVGQGAQDARANMTIDCGFVLPPLSLGNQVFEDKNNDGLFDAATETGLNSVLLNLYADTNNDGDVSDAELDTPMLTTTTAFSGSQPGFYLFSNLSPSVYVVELACSNFDAGGLLHGYASSSGQLASVAGPYEPFGDIDNALNDDDARDAGYALQNDAGQTCIRLLPAQLYFDSEPTGTGSGNDTSGNPADGIADEEEDPRFDNDATTPDRNENGVADFGVFKPYSLGNRVWLDKNDDGLMASDEPGLPGVLVRLYAINNTLLATTTTDAQGYYRFDSLSADSYVVEVENPVNTNALPLLPSSAYMRNSNPNGSGEVDKDDNGNTSTTAPSGRVATRSSPIPIGDAAASDSEPTGEADLESNPVGRTVDARYNATVDFGFYEPMQLGSRVFNDENNDGKRVSGERNGVVSVTLRLYTFDVSGIYNPSTPLASTRPSTATATFSDYFFTDLAPGSYVVEVVPDPDLVGYVSSSGKPGSFSGPYEGLCDSVVNANDGAGGGINNDDNGFVRADGRIFSCPFVLTNRDENAQDSVTNPNINNTLDFGIFRPLSLGNLVWNDLDDDGVFDSDELPIANVLVNLFWDANNDGNVDAGETGAPLVTATTTVNGLYLFTALGAGNYVVELDAQNFAANKPLSGFISSDAAENGATGAFEPAPDPDTASAQLDNDDSGTRVNNSVRSQPVTLRPNTEPLSEPLDNDPNTLDADENLTVDFGVYKPFSLGNRVFVDQNGSHRLDAGEVGVGLVTIRLYVAGTAVAIAETSTDQTGYYRFDKLRAGHYTVEVAPGAFYTDLGKVSPLLGFVSCVIDEADPNSNGDSNDNGLGSATSRSTGVRSNMVLLGKNGIEPLQEADLSSGANPQGADDDFGNMTVDFCFYKLASLGNRVWVDANKDGQQTAGEANISGVVVTLRGPGNTVVATATTDATGLYTFTHLIPGNYQVCFGLPAGYDFTQKGSNPAGTNDSNANTATGCTDAVALSSGENNPTLDVGVVPVQPQAVTLSRFVAAVHNNSVWVEWATGAEVDTFGFVLYRAESDNRAAAMLVTTEIIPAQGQSTRYRFNDLTAQAGARYFYWLVEIERDGDPLEYGPTQLAAAQAPRPVNVAVPDTGLPLAAVPVQLPAQTSASPGPIVGPTQPQQSQVEVVVQRVAPAPLAQDAHVVPQANTASAHTPSNAQPIHSISDAPAETPAAVATVASTSEATRVARGNSPTHNKPQAQQVAAHISALPLESNTASDNQSRWLGLLIVAGAMLVSITVLGGIGLAWRKRWPR